MNQNSEDGKIQRKIFRCEICDRNFKDEEGLRMHNDAKHAKPVEKPGKSLPVKKIKNSLIILVLISLAIYGIFLLIKNSNSFSELPAKDINIGSHKNIALHIHSHLKIIIDDEVYDIPQNIGVSDGIMRPLHTHDSSGGIHIEGPYPRDFSIGDFFSIWGKTFNSTCIFDYCTTNNSELKMYVNGQETNKFDNYILKDDDEIVIQYNSQD